MKIISLNIGLPRLFMYKGVTINSGIFKSPVSGPVALRTFDLDGDRQADLSVHGGVYKAVYAYPSEHYAFWKNALPGMDLPWGAFGENFTIEGLLEDDVHVGDEFEIGTARVMVRQPRMPCYKLAAKFQREDMIQKFLKSGKSGFYFSVEKEGVVENGDSFKLLNSNPSGVIISEMNRLYFREKYNRSLLQKAIDTPQLPQDWRDYFEERIDRIAANV
jgi:MOSC domain-containing protein YiiM